MEERFHTFTVLITKISRYIRRIKTVEMAEFDLKSQHVSCLYYLYKTEALTSKELCDICGEDKANISRSVKHLEERGLLACNSKKQKRYLSPLELTEKGKAVAEKIAKKIDLVLRTASEGLTEENRSVFYDSLTLICTNLQNVCSILQEEDSK